MKSATRWAGTALTATALTAGALAVATTVSASEGDGRHIRADFAAGDAELELETRNVHPIICFLLRHDAPDSGDSIATAIHRGSPGSPGPQVIDFGEDGWFDGGGEGCHIPEDPATARRIFDDPSGHYLHFEVIENQGTRVQRGPFRGLLRSQ